MSFPQGIDFRNTSGYVTDPTNYTSEIGTSANYPRTTPQGNSVGYTTAASINTRDRNAGNDARLAGIAFDSGPTIFVYEMDLPATGSYDIKIACGDPSYSRSNQKIEVFDNITSRGVLFTGASTGAANSFLDATGTVYTAANWPGSNTAVNKTFTSTKAIFKCGDGSNLCFIASIFMQASGGGAQNLTPSLYTNSISFFSATVAPGAVNLAPSLFTNSSSFFSPTVGAGTVNLTPNLFTNSSTFFSPTVASAGNLAPSLFTNPNTFFSPTVGRGLVNLAPTFFANSNIFYSPAVALAQPQTLLPSLYTNPNTFFLPVVRSHIVLLNVHVKLKAPHVFDNTEWPAETIFGLPEGQPVPEDFQYTPLMEGLNADSIAAVAQTSIDIFGRYDAHGNLLDNPPIPRPIYDPQPTPVVGDKHFLPLGNGSWP